MKEEALKLADELDALHQYVPSEAPAMIRRLVEELNCAEDYIKQYQLQTKPLSKDEIHDIWKSLWEGGNIGHIAYNYARAIEERHGIK